MYSKIFVVVCIQLAIFDAISSQAICPQYIKNIVPSCGCGGVDILPSQVLLNQPAYANVIPGLASNLVSPAIVNGQYALPSTNIIQDNSVANNLANTLQLLLVSNLLSNTLPNSPELLLPAVPSCGCGNGVSYIY